MRTDLLIVDDEPNDIHLISSQLQGFLRENKVHEIIVCSTAAAAMSAVKNSILAGNHILILLDLYLARGDSDLSLGFLDAVSKLASDDTLISVIITTKGTPEEAVRHLEHGADDYVCKGESQDNNLRYRVGLRLRDMGRRFEANARLQIAEQTATADIVGTSGVVTKLRHQILVAAQVNKPVLIRGDTGTGKELVANAVHYASPRMNSPFFTVNLGGMPSQLADSELFGHEKGAFTGATARRIGCFESVGDGTVFLDEIGDAPPEVQVKLLRVLDGYPFRRLGGDKEMTFNGVFVAATHQDLEELIEKGKFREDLYYRLKVCEVRTPSVAERRGDIPLLLEHFARLKGFNLKQLSNATRDFLATKFEWPGNVRQISNFVEWLLTRSFDTDCIEEVVAYLTDSKQKKQRYNRVDTDGLSPLDLRSLIAAPHKHANVYIDAVRNNDRDAILIRELGQHTGYHFVLYVYALLVQENQNRHPTRTTLREVFGPGQSPSGARNLVIEYYCRATGRADFQLIEFLDQYGMRGN